MNTTNTRHTGATHVAAALTIMGRRRPHGRERAT